MIEKTEEKESVGVVAASDTVAVIGGAVVVAVLRKLNGGRWRQHLAAVDGAE